MTDIVEAELKRMGEKLELLAQNSMASSGGSERKLPEADQIDLLEMLNTFWVRKNRILLITFLFSVCSVIYALSLPNLYKSTVMLTSSQADNEGALGGVAAKYGGLAAIAGISLDSGDLSRIEQAVELMKSWPFLEGLVEKYDLKPKIMAAIKWDKKSNALIFDQDLYDAEDGVWINSRFSDTTVEPSSWKTYKHLSKMIEISLDKKNLMVTISVEHVSPYDAFNIVGKIEKEINSFYQKQDMLEAKKNIDYLEEKISETNIAEMQVVFYSMIESQIRALMLSEVNDQYVLKTVVPAKISEEKSSPKRGVICLMGAFFGFVFSLVIVLFGDVLNKKVTH